MSDYMILSVKPPSSAKLRTVVRQVQIRCTPAIMLRDVSPLGSSGRKHELSKKHPDRPCDLIS